MKIQAMDTGFKEGLARAGQMGPEPWLDLINTPQQPFILGRRFEVLEAA